MKDQARIRDRSTPNRLSTGLSELDKALGGGLIPGSLTLVVGATGIGKTQLGTHFCCGEADRDGQFGAIIDLSSRGDSQFHEGYAQRMFGRNLCRRDISREAISQTSEWFDELDAAQLPRPADVLAFLGYRGRRVLRSQMEPDAWDAWQAEMNRRTPELFRFVYQHLMCGTTRFVIDGIEPTADSADSLQMDLVELIYHRMLRQEYDWLAREVLRQRFRELESLVHERAYDHRDNAAMVLVTTRHTMLDALLEEPLADGDVSAGANTLILMGKIAVGNEMKRGLAIVKHRGSYADSRVHHFEINDQGLKLLP